MKLPSYRLVVAIIAAGVGTALLAQEQHAYAEISLAGPGKGTKTIDKSQYIILVVEGSTLSFEGNLVPEAQVVPFVNDLLKRKGVSYIGLYAREGSKYGELVHAVDVLRGTTAKNIGVSISELPLGREP